MESEWLYATPQQDEAVADASTPNNSSDPTLFPPHFMASGDISTNISTDVSYSNVGLPTDVVNPQSSFYHPPISLPLSAWKYAQFLTPRIQDYFPPSDELPPAPPAESIPHEFPGIWDEPGSSDFAALDWNAVDELLDIIAEQSPEQGR
jgi:hypothetical protein